MIGLFYVKCQNIFLRVSNNRDILRTWQTNLSPCAMVAVGIIIYQNKRLKFEIQVTIFIWQVVQKNNKIIK